VILDEADHFILDQVENFRLLPLTSPIIGFTATTTDEKYSQIQNQFYSEAGFRVNEFWPQELSKPTKPCIDKKIPSFDSTQLTDYI